MKCQKCGTIIKDRYIGEHECVDLENYNEINNKNVSMATTDLKITTIGGEKNSEQVFEVGENDLPSIQNAAIKEMHEKLETVSDKDISGQNNDHAYRSENSARVLKSLLKDLQNQRHKAAEEDKNSFERKDSSNQNQADTHSDINSTTTKKSPGQNEDTRKDVQTSDISDKDDIANTDYAPFSLDNLDGTPDDQPAERRRHSLPSNAVKKDEPRQAWNANLNRRMSGKVGAPKPTKKYRHYPVSCEFCNKKFQPGLLAKHIQKRHPDEHLPPSVRGNGKITPEERQEESSVRKKRGGMPRQMRICYICGRLYGSLSIKIHEPKCLEKWKIENEKLPRHKRMPEPVKPEPIKEPDSGAKLPGSKGYDQHLPELNPQAEAAYHSHLQNLVPCDFCGRTFNPDRVMVHQKACIERPEKRKKPYK